MSETRLAVSLLRLRVGESGGRTLLAKTIWLVAECNSSRCDNVYFLTRKPLLDELARQEITIIGSLVASYNDVIIQAAHIRVEPKPEEKKRHGALYHFLAT